MNQHMYICFNGRFLKAASVKISPFDQGFLYGDGVYETLRTYRGKLWQLDLHLKRLKDSLHIAKIKIPWSIQELGEFIERLVAQNGHRESRIRLMITRGVSSTKGAFFRPSRMRLPTLLITCFRLPVWKPGLLQTGRCVFFDLERNFPSVKTTSIFPLILARIHADDHDAADALLVSNRGFVNEGATSNIFVYKNGTLVTPDKDILKGTMRDFILKLVRIHFRDSVRVRFGTLSKSELFAADEIFLTNAPRGIIGVSHIAGRSIGNPSAMGKPFGDVQSGFTAHIKKLFDEYIHAHFS